MIPQKEQDRRKILIRDAIFGLARRYPARDVALLACLDLFTLLLQKWVVLVIWRQGDAIYEPMVSTLCDPLLKEQYKYPHPRPVKDFQVWNPQSKAMRSFNAIDLVPSLNGHVILTVAELSKGKPTEDCSSLKEIAHLLHDKSFWRDAENEFSRIFSDVTFFQHYPTDPPHFYREPKGKSVQRLLESLTDALDDFLRLKADSPFLAYGSSRFTKLHFCVKWGFTSSRRNDKWPYTMRLLLPKVQQETLSGWLGYNGGEQKLSSFIRFRTKGKRPSAILAKFTRAIRAVSLPNRGSKLIAFLQTPLSSGARAIADSSLVSGCLDFDHAPGGDLDKAAAEEDMLRQEAEAFMYWACHLEDKSSRQPSTRRIVYIPIHVNGAPWLNVYSFSSGKPEDSEAWNHNYLLYRDLLPELGGKVREQMMSHYLAIVGSLVRRTANCRPEDVDPTLREVNREFEELAVFCPMPKLGFSESETEKGSDIVSRSIYVPALRRTVCLSVSTNGLHPSHVNYTILQPQQLLKHCIEEWEDEMGIRERLENRSLAYNTHLLSTPLRALATHIDEGDTQMARKLVRRLNRLREYATALVDSGKTISEPARIPSDKFSAWIETYVREVAAQANTCFFRNDNVDVAIDLLEKGIDYHKTHIEALVATAIENAVEHSKDGTTIRAFIGTCAVGLSKGKVCLFLTNSVQGEISLLRKRIQSLNDPTPNNVGLMTLRLGTAVYINRNAVVQYSVDEAPHGDIHNVTLELPLARYANA